MTESVAEPVLEYPSLRGRVAARRLSAEECDEIVAIARTFRPAPPNIVGIDHLDSFRLGETRKIYPTSPKAIEILHLALAIAQEENEKHFLLALDGILTPPEYVEYVPGNGHFKWHDDYSHGLSDAPRKLTVVFQLSDSSEYDGGGFESWSVPTQTLSRARGSVLVVPSFVPHQVAPVTRGCRRVLVVWVGGPRLK